VSSAAVHRASAVLAVASVIPAARLSGFHPSWLWLTIALALPRVFFRRGERAVVGKPLLAILGATALFLGVLVLHRLAGRTPEPLVELLQLLAVLLVLCLSVEQRPFLTFLVLLLSTTLVAGAAFLRQDTTALLLTIGHVLLLLWTLLLFERSVAGSRSHAWGERRPVVAVTPETRIPHAAVFRTLGQLAPLGFAIGALLFFAAPRGLFDGGAGDTDAEQARVEEGAADPSDRPAGTGPFRTGPDGSAKGIQLGDVGEIKRDPTTFYEVRLPPGRRPLLRENTYDRYSHPPGTLPGWAEDPAAMVFPSWRLPAVDDADAWIPIGAETGEPGFDVFIEQLRGNQRRLFLPPEPVRVRVLRAGAPLDTALSVLPNEQVDCRDVFLAGDVVHAWVTPPPADDERLRSARSDASVAPRPTSVELPAPCRPLETVARRVVGGETNPWVRAQLLRDWLKGPAFTYTLEMPTVDTRAPVVDFVVRTRRGHCEYFATALTLMLRSLGHPARVARGFRGGDWQPVRRSWIVRGTHYHLWTELYLEGVGWIPLDPTPPDREAVDADTLTRAPEVEARARRSLAQRILEYGRSEREALGAALADGIRRYVARPLGFLFSRDGWFSGFVLVLLVGVGLRLRHRSTDRRRRSSGTHRAPPPGPYGKALRLLAKKGIRRRRQQTAREFHGTARRFFAEIDPEFERLTRLHEQALYGGAAWGSRERREARAAVAALAQRLRRRDRSRSRKAQASSGS
jgi:transglutaminase-like putative cysteine protease